MDDGISILSLYVQKSESVFAKEDFDILLDHCRWDHAIEIIPKADLKLFKVYLLSFSE